MVKTLYGNFPKSRALIWTPNSRALAIRTPTKRIPLFIETAVSSRVRQLKLSLNGAQQVESKPKISRTVGASCAF